MAKSQTVRALVYASLVSVPTVTLVLKVKLASAVLTRPEPGVHSHASYVDIAGMPKAIGNVARDGRHFRKNKGPGEAITSSITMRPVT